MGRLDAKKIIVLFKGHNITIIASMLFIVFLLAWKNNVSTQSFLINEIDRLQYLNKNLSTNLNNDESFKDMFITNHKYVGVSLENLVDAINDPDSLKIIIITSKKDKHNETLGLRNLVAFLKTDLNLTNTIHFSDQLEKKKIFDKIKFSNKDSKQIAQYHTPILFFIMQRDKVKLAITFNFEGTFEEFSLIKNLFN